MWQIQNDHELVHYANSLEIMRNRHTQIVNNQEKSLLWLLEHQEIYTIGKATKQDHILNPAIEIVETDRGGQATYHGPGQVVAYTIFDLRLIQHKPDIRVFVKKLEEIMINVLEEFDIKGYADPNKIGAWVDGQKIGFIGLKVGKWVTYHGIALNVNVDIEKFEQIIPCGIQNCKITSLQRLGIATTTGIIKEKLINHFARYCYTFVNST